MRATIQTNGISNILLLFMLLKALGSGGDSYMEFGQYGFKQH